MGQRLVKRDVTRGSKLFQEQRFEEAIAEWQTVLKKATKSRDRFQVLGCLCHAQLELGKVRDALVTAGQQFEIANLEKAASFKCQAFYNIALCNERSSEFTKAVSYCRYSLESAAQQEESTAGETSRQEESTSGETSRQEESISGETSRQEEKAQAKAARTEGVGMPGGGVGGYVQLCLGSAYLGLSEFPKAWASLLKALALAKDDKILEILALCELGLLMCNLNDADTGLDYCSQAWSALDSLPEGSATAQRYRRHVAARLALPYRKLGRYNDAMDRCEDALKVAMLYGDRPVQARCLFMFADTHRKRGDYERAYPRYESAYSIMAEISDKLGQVQVLGGMAKTSAAMGNLPQAMELNEKALELAKKIGNKLEMLRCHGRLHVLYEEKGDATLAHRHGSALRQLLVEMDLLCGVCDEMLGQQPERVEALACGHFVHARCAVHLARSTLGRSGKARPCPACRRKSACNPVMYP